MGTIPTSATVRWRAASSKSCARCRSPKIFSRSSWPTKPMGVNLDDFTVQVTDSIRTAMVKINANRHRAVVVIDEGIVVGTVTDGDIRRAILDDVLPIAP